MTGELAGAVVGGTAGTGMVLALSRALTLPRSRFEQRVLAHLRDLPQLAADRPVDSDAGAVSQLVGSLVHPVARRVESVLGGSASIRRRLERAGSDLTVADVRIQQVTWGLVAFACSSVAAVLLALRSPQRSIPLAVLCLIAFVAGVLLRENRLTAQVTSHERLVLEELPAVAELLALSVAAGEGPVAALSRVVSRSRGALAADLSRVLGEVRTGSPVAHAFDAYASRTGLPVVARFADAIAVAIERGTPLADVLHAQAADVREAHRRFLIESGARREVAMMVPVVFFVLPVTVLFAFWPGIVGLHLATS